jgi:hypothetical protein
MQQSRAEGRERGEQRREERAESRDAREKQKQVLSSTLSSPFPTRCSGIHRSLGTHISRVRSIELDEWTEEQIEVGAPPPLLRVLGAPRERSPLRRPLWEQFLGRKGNKLINLIYEANIPSTQKKITPQSSHELHPPIRDRRSSVENTFRKINLLFPLVQHVGHREATAYIKAKYQGQFKCASGSGWKGATVAQETYGS